jgi:hypothetical protein
MPPLSDRPASRTGRDRDLLPRRPAVGPYESPYEVVIDDDPGFEDLRVRRTDGDPDRSGEEPRRALLGSRTHSSPDFHRGYGPC